MNRSGAACYAFRVRLARLWLVLLLSVLLPVRGALAAAMAWPSASAPVAGQVADDAAMPCDMPGMETPAPHAQDGAHPDKCSTCESCCAGTALPSSPPALPGPQAIATAAFPAVDAPATRFLADGQDRPPRSP